MIKKYLSGIVAVSLGLALIPTNAMAGENINIKGFNATKSAIIVDFNNVTESIDKDSLDDRIVIKKYSADGKISVIDQDDFSVTTTRDVVGDGNAITAEGNTVIITPTSGVDTESLYNVEFLPGVSDSDGTTLNKKENTGWFKVEELFFDDFNVTYVSNGKTPKYPYYISTVTSGLREGGMESSYWNGSYRSEFTGIYDGTGKVAADGKMQFRNNSQWVSLNGEGLPASETVSDYTVEYTLGLPNTANGAVHSVLLREPTLSNFDFSKGYLFIVASDYNYSNNTGSIYFKAKDKEKARVSGYAFNSNTVDVRVSAIGSNLKWFIDDDKVLDITDESVTSKGTVAFAAGTMWNGTKHTTVDNVSITKVMKYGENLPELKVEDCYADDTKIQIVLSDAVSKEKIEDYILFRSENGEDVDFSMDVEGKTITLTPKSALEEGKYIITLKENMNSLNLALISNSYQLGIEVFDGYMYNVPVLKPEVSNVEISVKNEKFTMTYDYSGENDNASEYYIYAGKTPDGEFEEIASGSLEGDELIINTDEKYVDSYIKAKIIPKDSKGYLNNKIETDVLKGMFAPVIKNVKIEDNFEQGSLKVISYDFYDENGDEDLTEIQWYASDEMDGEYALIEGAYGAELIIDSTLKNKFIRAYILPKTSTYPYEGKVYESEYFCRTYEPEAIDVKIKGEATIGAEVTVEYTYYDKNQKKDEPSSEAGTSFRWLIADAVDGVYSEIEGKIVETITIEKEYVDKFLKVEVTPKKTGATGSAVLSDAFVLPAHPEVKNVEISGTIEEGYVVFGVYEYVHRNNVSEGESKYKWYVDGEVVSEEKEYTIKKADAGKKICFEVSPVAKKEPSVGKSVKSPEKTIEEKYTQGSFGGGFKGGSLGAGTIANRIENDMDKIQETQNTLITNFIDIGESPYQKEIVELYDKGIIKGVSETEFKPDREITRAEFVTLMVRFLEVNISEYQNIFLDVKKEDWYADNVQAAYNNKFVEGYAGYFRPQDGIKIEEILKILVEIYEKNGTLVETDEKSFKNVSEWAVEYASKSKKLGLISDDKEFTLNGKATRDEAAALISRFLEKKVK